MGGGGGGTSETNQTNQQIFNVTGGNLDFGGMFAFNYKGGDMNWRRDIENTAKGDFTNRTEQSATAGGGGDSAVGLGYGTGGGSGGGSGGGGGGGGGFGSASNSGYYSASTSTSGGDIIKGIDSKWLLGGGIAIGLAFILANRRK